jgi:ATP-dependent Zn protease
MKLRSLVHELYAQSKKLIADNKDLMIVLWKILDKREYIHKEEFAELMAAWADLEAVAERIKWSNL